MSDKMNPIQAKPGRRSGVELLRILAAMAVIVLHFNYLPGASGAADCASGFNRTFLNALESLCICAVDVFLLISGYFGSRGKAVKIRKMAMLLLQTSFIRLAASLGFCVLSRRIDFGKLVLALLPVNYYVILYVSLMLLSPFINSGLEKLSDVAIRKLVLISFSLFALFSTFVDVAESLTDASLSGLNPVSIDGSINGYTIVNFVLLYLLGAWLRREEDALAKMVSTPLLWVGLLITAALIYLWQMLQRETAVMYSNPLVILEACMVFMLFARMQLDSKHVNLIAPASFSCFLLQGYILPFLDYERIAAASFPMLFGILALTVIGIYTLSIIAYVAWNWLSKKLLKKTEGWTISAE